MEQQFLTAEAAAMILKILKRGDTVELKRERGEIVIVEIRRKKQTSVTG